MSNYKIVVSSRVDHQLLTHFEFITRVSIPAARRFRDEYARILDDLEESLYSFLWMLIRISRKTSITRPFSRNGTKHSS